jgi:hypothetical protein
MYFKTFKEDVGIYQLNTSSLFHFINIIRYEKSVAVNEGFDFTAFNIIGLQVFTDTYLNNIQKEGIFHKNHWIYGICNKEINAQMSDNLINYDFFEISACIKKFYSKDDKKYYDIGDPNFVWPTIEHGTIHENNTLYSIFIQKCDNDILKNVLNNNSQCKSPSELEEYLNGTSKAFHFYFINNYINVRNFSHPNSQFFYRLESPINRNQFTTNSININPSHIKTNHGLLLDRTSELSSYMFDRNDVYISEKNNKNIFICYSFFLKNIIENYERTYKRIQDAISSIGGINQAITIIAIYLNTLYNRYIVLSDTEVLLNSAICTEKQIHKRKAVQYDAIKKNGKEITELENLDKTEALQKSYTPDTLKKSLTERRKNDTDFSENKINSKNFLVFNLNTNNKKENFDYIEAFKKDNYKYKKKKHFFYYFIYKISCGKKNKFFNIYEDFRFKIISEEHLIRNHLNIYNLLKVTERKRRAHKYSYQLKDLIKLV